MFTIATINSSINLKAQANYEGRPNKFNFYLWVKQAHVNRPDLTFIQFYQIICLANCTEVQCYSRIPIN
jgi:hypothetical protein